MHNSSRQPQHNPRPLAWVALAVSTVVAVVIWLLGTQTNPAFLYSWFGINPFPELTFLALAVIVAAILDIAAARRGRTNRIIALIAFLILLAPIAISLIPLP